MKQNSAKLQHPQHISSHFIWRAVAATTVLNICSNVGPTKARRDLRGYKFCKWNFRAPTSSSLLFRFILFSAFALGNRLPGRQAGRQEGPKHTNLPVVEHCWKLDKDTWTVGTFFRCWSNYATQREDIVLWHFSSQIMWARHDDEWWRDG